MAVLTWRQERNKRNKNLMLLGVVLIVGWIMPIIKPDPIRSLVGSEFVFPTITMFLDGQTPAPMIAANMIPLLAGIMMIALAGAGHSQMRGLTMIVLPTIMVLLIVAAMHSAGVTLANIPQDPDSIRPILMVLMMGLSSVLILAGLRIAAYRTDRKLGPALALLGAVLYAPAVLAPMIPGEYGMQAYFDLPFKFILSDSPGARPLGVYLGIELGLMLLTSLMCLLLFLSRISRKNRPAIPGASAPLICWIGSRIFTVVAFLTQAQISGGSDQSVLLVAMTKSLLMGGAMFILFCAGVADLALGPPPGSENWVIQSG
jgi:hypothetical protein